MNLKHKDSKKMECKEPYFTSQDSRLYIKKDLWHVLARGYTLKKICGKSQISYLYLQDVPFSALLSEQP